MAKKMKKPAMQSQRYLPDDIILEILHRLPVDSLLRFTSVSKSWKASIKSSSFIYHHQNNKRSSHSHLVYMSDSCRPNFTLISDSVVLPLTKKSLHQLRSDDVRIIGSCEGLICLITNPIIYIWNPFIRTMKRIPAGEIPIKEYYIGYFVPWGGDTILGFGFAPQSGDYRVVKLLWDANCATEVEIYSLSTDSWRRIKPPSGLDIFLEKSLDDSGLEIFLEKKKSLNDLYCIFYFCAPVVSFKGSIYWLAYCYGEKGVSCQILRFDLDKELLEKIGAPKIDLLVVVDGFLVLLKFMHQPNDQEIHIKAYIKKESESGSSFWASKSILLPKDKEDIVYYKKKTTSGNIILVRKDGRIFVYDCYCDGNDLSFKLRDLGINVGSCRFDLIPIQETLLLVDKNISESTLDFGY